MAVNRTNVNAKKQQKLGKIRNSFVDIVADLDIVLDTYDEICSSPAEARERADAAIAILRGTTPPSAADQASITIDEAIDALPAESRRIARMAANGQLTEDWIRNANQHLHGAHQGDVLEAVVTGPVLSAIGDAADKAAHAVNVVNGLHGGFLTNKQKVDEATTAVQEAKAAIDHAKQEAEAAAPAAPPAPQPIALPAAP